MTKRTRITGLSWGAAALLLVAAVGVLWYFIFGPSLGTMHSDCTDSLLWAQATVETGKILSKDFSYAALLPFGSSLWMVPVLHLFGYTLAAQQISMAIFAILFVAAVFWLLRCLERKPHEAAIGAFCVSMLLSGSTKLREIMWEHTIYYSLSVLLFVVVAALAVTFQKRMSKLDSTKNKVIAAVFGGLLLLICAGCATDGMQILILTAAPILAGIVMVSFSDERPFTKQPLVKRGITVGVMVIGMVIGLLLLVGITQNGEIFAGYENAYTAWAPMEKWGENASRFWVHYLSLFGVAIKESDPLISLESIGMLCRLVVAVAVLACPILMFVRYRRLTSATKMVLWGHTVVSAAVMFGFICGYLSAANWRLTPMLGTGLVLTVICVFDLFSDGVVARRFAVIAAAMLVLVSVLNMVAIGRLPTDIREQNPHIEIAETLAEKGYTHGYASFWNASNTMLLSDEKLTVATVTVETDGIHRRDYQTFNWWFDEIAAQDKVFLLLSIDEYGTLTSGDAWDRLAQDGGLVETFECRGFYVAVFDGQVL